MSLHNFAHLEPLPSHLTGRTRALRLDDLPGKRPLQAKRAPRPVGCGLGLPLFPKLPQYPLGGEVEVDLRNGQAVHYYTTIRTPEQS
jgi:hypothetical protein